MNIYLLTNTIQASNNLVITRPDIGCKFWYTPLALLPCFLTFFLSTLTRLTPKLIGMLIPTLIFQESSFVVLEHLFPFAICFFGKVLHFPFFAIFILYIWRNVQGVSYESFSIFYLALHNALIFVISMIARSNDLSSCKRLQVIQIKLW